VAAFPVAIRCHGINILLRDTSDSSEVPSKLSLDLGDDVADGHEFAGSRAFFVACCFDATARGEQMEATAYARLSLKRDLVVGTGRVRRDGFSGPSSPAD